ncbi:phosphatase PAP2 family protein [Marinoscillum sp. 108]|uniref:phosphatase PAP2 family protein n=1 Tax=Marinoscillum sp. 108 TaxID=2653151 RepID=UPI0012F1531D|nr:phosphatase PAP2 family protein [Marinoscillum sp. 108]VXD10455.1 Undecaprenyl-diphosphatase [Marinoscillum sp. 108]
MLEWVLELDEKIFLTLNGLGSPYLDTFMIWMSDKYLWIPLYLYLIFRLYQQEGKKLLWPLITLIVVIICTDQTTAGFMKPYFERLRPCKDPALEDLIVIIGECRGKFGFASGHAANSFGLAAFFYFKERSLFSKGLLLWAAIVSYSRVYLGVHYPADILVGMLVGVFWAYVLYATMKSFRLRAKAY